MTALAQKHIRSQAFNSHPPVSTSSWQAIESNHSSWFSHVNRKWWPLHNPSALWGLWSRTTCGTGNRATLGGILGRGDVDRAGQLVTSSYLFWGQTFKSSRGSLVASTWFNHITKWNPQTSKLVNHTFYLMVQIVGWGYQQTFHWRSPPGNACIYIPYKYHITYIMHDISDISNFQYI